MTDAQKLNSLEALLTALESGIKIVDQTFYRDPPSPGMTPEHTHRVVHTMLLSIQMYRDAST